MEAVCPNCNTVHTGGEVFCNNCGTFLPPAQTHNMEEKRETISDANGLLLALYYTLTVFMPMLGIILGAVMIFAGQEEIAKRRGRGLTVFAFIMLLLHLLLMLLQPFLSMYLGFLF